MHFDRVTTRLSCRQSICIPGSVRGAGASERGREWGSRQCTVVHVRLVGEGVGLGRGRGTLWWHPTAAVRLSIATIVAGVLRLPLGAAAGILLVGLIAPVLWVVIARVRPTSTKVNDPPCG